MSLKVIKNQDNEILWTGLDEESSYYMLQFCETYPTEFFRFEVAVSVPETSWERHSPINFDRY